MYFMCLDFSYENSNSNSISHLKYSFKISLSNLVQEFNNAEAIDRKIGKNRTLEERIGRSLKQAGVGITGMFI